MRRCSLWVVALLSLSLFARPGVSQEKDKKDDPKPEKKEPEKKDPPKPAVKTVTVSGELTQIETGKQAFRLKVTEQYTELNQGAVNEIAQAQNEMRTARDAGTLLRARQKLLGAQAKLYQVKTRTKDLMIDADADMKVRLPAPKSAFDDMGNIKTYTPKELAALRGPDKFFDGDFSDLTSGQLVQVTIIAPKPPMKPKSKDDVPLEDPKLEATRVAVIKNPGVDGPKK